MTLSEKILTLRKQAGWFQEELAAELNVSRQAVSRWEVGSAQPDAFNVLQLSKLFGVTTDYLLHDEYESDDDLPKIRKKTESSVSTIVSAFTAVEIMLDVALCYCAIILKNLFFTGLFVLPLFAVVAGFEISYRSEIAKATEKTRKIRREFYISSAWFGCYFPVRFLGMIVDPLIPHAHSAAAFEYGILAVYILVATLISLWVHRKCKIEE